MKAEEYLNIYKVLLDRYQEMIQNINIKKLAKEREKLNLITSREGFWNDKIKAKSILRDISLLNKDILDYENNGDESTEIFFDKSLFIKCDFWFDI